jgi:hypothetical protein
LKRTVLGLVILAATPGILATPVRADDMEKVANSFYATYVGLPRAGGIPDATARVRYAPLLSPRLGRLIVDAAAAEIRFSKQNKNAPPLIEGDLFSSLFEGFTQFKVGACSGDAKTGQCSINLTYQDKKSLKPVSWNDTLLLVNTPSGWKVDDLAYKAGFQFGNTGLLSDTLKMAISEAPP